MTASSWAPATAAQNSQAPSSPPNPSSPPAANNSSKTFSRYSCLRVTSASSASLRYLFLSCSPIQVRQNRPIYLHPIPEMPQPQILIRTVLMIVVVHDRHTDPWQPDILKDVHRHTPAQPRSNHRMPIRRALH